MNKRKIYFGKGGKKQIKSRKEKKGEKGKRTD